MTRLLKHRGTQTPDDAPEMSVTDTGVARHPVLDIAIPYDGPAFRDLARISGAGFVPHR